MDNKIKTTLSEVSRLRIEILTLRYELQCLKVELGILKTGMRGFIRSVLFNSANNICSIGLSEVAPIKGAQDLQIHLSHSLSMDVDVFTMQYND